MKKAKKREWSGKGMGKVVEKAFGDIFNELLDTQPKTFEIKDNTIKVKKESE